MTVPFDPFAGYDIGIAVLGVMLAVAGIVLGLGIAADDRKLKELGRAELYQTFINAAILGALFIGFSQFGIFTAMINGMTGGVTQQSCDPSLGYNSAICFAYNYLVGSAFVTIDGHAYPSLITSTLSMLAPATVLYMVIGTLSTLNISFVVSIGLAGLKVFLGPLNGIIELLVANVFMIGTQAVILRFIALTAVPVILPVGLVLRTFYFTRRLGGTLIAIAIGFFAVFPLTYVLDAQLIDYYSAGSSAQLAPAAVSALQNMTDSAQSISGSTFTLSQLLFSTPYNSIGSNPFSTINNMLSGLAGVFSVVISALENAVAMLVIQVFLLPAFSLILTIISVRELAKALGSEISFGRFDIF